MKPRSDQRPTKNQTRPKSFLSLFILLGTASFSGCAGFRPTQSGYLSDYSDLSKEKIPFNRGLGKQNVFYRNAPAGKLDAIDSFYIEPAAWLVDPASKAGRDLERRQQLTNALETALREELGSVRPVVEQPGPNTATVRSAITDVKLAKPGINAILTAVPIANFTVGPVFNGGGIVEAEILAPDKSQIAIVSCASEGGTLDLFGFYIKWNHAKKAMRRVAKELRDTVTANPSLAPTTQDPSTTPTQPSFPETDVR